MTWIIAIALIAAGVIGLWAQHENRKAAEQREAYERQSRRDRLSSKYHGDAHLPDIQNGIIRPGMTAQQLLDAWGQPAAIDERVLKTKVVHTYKYAQTGKRSFRQKVKVENGIVVGWSNTD